MTETTRTEMYNAVEQVGKYAHHFGLVPNGMKLVMDEGELSSGIAYRLLLMPIQGYALHSVGFLPDNGLLGFTRTEAAETLWRIASVFKAVHDKQENKY